MRNYIKDIFTSLVLTEDYYPIKSVAKKVLINWPNHVKFLPF